MSDHVFAKGDRVRYLVMYSDGLGSGLDHIVRRPAFGRITRLREHPRRGTVATIAVENPKRGSARYVERAVTDIQLDPAPTAIPGWTAADLHTLIMTAGEIAVTYGTGTDGLDRDDVLSTRQRDILRKASRSYYAELGEEAEQDSDNAPPDSTGQRHPVRGAGPHRLTVRIGERMLRDELFTPVTSADVAAMWTEYHREVNHRFAHEPGRIAVVYLLPA
jgi:hypothetical protein